MIRGSMQVAALATVALLVSAEAPASAAVPLPAARQISRYTINTFPAGDSIAQVSLSGDGSTPFDLESSPVPTVGVPYLIAAANASGTPFVSTTAGITSGYSVTSFSFLQYSLTVSGGDSQLVVPLNYSALLHIETSGGGVPFGILAGAHLALSAEYQAVTRNYDAQRCIGQYICGTFGVPDQSINDTISILTGSRLNVSMTVESNAINGGASHAYLDPYFAIDPTFLAAHPNLSLSLSEFVGNDAPSGAVPEPATWAMMISGFGLVGASMRRRKVSAAVRLA